MNNLLLLFVFVIACLAGFIIINFTVQKNNKIKPSLLLTYPDVNERIRAWHKILKPSEMEDLLKSIVESGSGKPFHLEEDVPVNNVLAEEWEKSRLDSAIEGIKENSVAPRIRVVRYWLYGKAWYVVDDGNHRTMAARIANKQYIQAIVIGEYSCSPESYYLDMNTHILWKLTQLDDVYFKPEKIKTELSRTAENALLDIGVKTVPDDSNMWQNIRKAKKGTLR